MMRSLYSGISGLRNHQTRMDVIGNNISNVNTASFKASRVVFQDIFSQNVAAGMAADPAAGVAGVGGTNPMQIGLGIRLSNIDVVHTRSAFQRTDRPEDMMINGDGFFVVRGPEGDFFTRAGNFTIDNEGFLVNPQGFFVMGSAADSVELVMGLIDPGRPMIPAQDAIDVADAVDVPNPRYPGFGPEYVPGFTLVAGTRLPAGFFQQGDWVPADLFGDGVPANGFTVGRAGFPADSSMVVDATTTIPILANATANRNVRALPAIAAVQPRFGLVPGDGVIPGGDGLVPIQMRTMANDVPAFADWPLETQDAFWDALEAGEIDPTDPRGAEAWIALNFPGMVEIALPGFSVADNGDVSAEIGNRKVVFSRISIAMFANPAGLERAGNSLFLAAESSGPPVMTTALNDGAGMLMGGGLEMSNVDLSDQFTDMIVTQRGFQANSRVITVSDSMLEELVNLKR